MRKILLTVVVLLASCKGIQVPDDFEYSPVKTQSYTIARWQKITDETAPVHLYIEGDGYAFNARGYPTSDPTPKGKMLRMMAFNDPSANVIYLARPCQFIKESHCSQTDWTTGRFSVKIIDSMSEAVQKSVRHQPVVLIGYSGGALLSGLIIRQNSNLNVKRWITIAGVLNHSSWTNYFHDQPLTDSVDLKQLPSIEQTHFVGGKDKVVPLDLAKSWSDVSVIPNATHASGWDVLDPAAF